MAGNAVEAGRTVTSKVTAILMAFADGSEWTLSELARLTHIPLTTTHRLVAELAAARLLERTTAGGYKVGPAVGRLHRDDDRCGSTVAQLAPAVLDDLASATGGPVRLGVLRDLRVAYVEKAGRAPATSFAAGAVLPAHASALGKVLLAFAPAATTRAVVAAGLPRYTTRTLSRPGELAHALSVTRLTRVANCDGELVEGECAVAAPVQVGGRVLAALEARVPNLRSLDLTRRLLTVAARSMSRELAGVPGPVAVSPVAVSPVAVSPVAVSPVAMSTAS
jgi:DNA-binding IclR family transcriptional regulator